jgi:hypothetical protein
MLHKRNKLNIVIQYNYYFRNKLIYMEIIYKYNKYLVVSLKTYGLSRLYTYINIYI